MISADCGEALERVARNRGRVLVLTGAGISAESGIPTFRGPEGYWKVGSHNYAPEKLATWSAFQKMPEEIWAWYLYRRSVCLAAAPNSAHRALAKLEQHLGERLTLVTQNVDGLHLRAGNSAECTLQIHGNIHFMRPSRGGSPRPMPAAIVDDWPKGKALDAATRALLCIDDGWMRPHVLWFDETYDEENYRWDSSQIAAHETDLLVVIGTSGATNLPMHIGAIVASRGVPMLVINRDPNPFSAEVERFECGWFAQGQAGEIVPEVVQKLVQN